MARTLYLLRHAKSSWDEPLLADFDRPLNPRGRKAAPRMAKAMKDSGLLPGMVLCSAARRTQQTWELVAPQLPADLPVRMLRSLYLATPSRMLSALSRVPAEVERVLMIAHNPGTEQLALRLAGPGSKAEALADMSTKFPTAALAEIRFEAPDWSALTPGSGKLVRFLRPRDL